MTANLPQKCTPEPNRSTRIPVENQSTPGVFVISYPGRVGDFELVELGGTLMIRF